MPATACSPSRHVWHVHEEQGHLNTTGLRHGKSCACGKRRICMITCDHGCRHKRVVTRQEFDRYMEDNG